MSTIDQLGVFLRTHGANVSSVPNTWPVRFDIEPTQSEALMTLLADAGWRPMPRGASTQLGYHGFQDALVYEIAKPRSGEWHGVRAGRA
jgi:hypothetical protein